ncbi:uncharacterized protein LOC132870918 isoform X2 [Neoarius graeffei]|uniref:uncharacterized protein LOC132870918 isoform X2 n=1 Tax=Neoarius graeffei TaxID=443677 RepID=UPI00298CCBFF|nr:uncharacterized protein LOC132870918 isoform X2 [Neoarius graeffei]
MSFSAENKCDQLKHELDEAYSEGCVDLDTADSVVKRFSGTLIPLIKPKSYSVRVCGQDGTVYAGNDDQLEAWKDFYLPERMEMVVIGAIDDFPCDAFDLQLVLLLCEDGKIYAYEDEELHLVARSVNELFETGLTFPGLECYKLGECFEDYTEEEYSEIMESDDMKKMKEAHDKYRESLETELWETLKEFKRSQCEDVVQRSMVQPQNSDTMKERKELVIRKDMPVDPSDGKLFNNACLYEHTVYTVKGHLRTSGHLLIHANVQSV